MEGNDASNDDIWSTSLRDELFSDFNLGPDWFHDTTDTRQYNHPIPPRRPTLPSLRPPNQPTLIQQQQQRLHNTRAPNSPPLFHFQGSTPLDRKRPHLNLPNFPIPTGTSSNSSGHPPRMTHRQPPHHPTAPSTRHIITPTHIPPPPLHDGAPSSPDLTDFYSESSTSPRTSSEAGTSCGFVDLTQDSSPPSMPPIRQRKASSLSETSPNASKRRKTGTEPSQSSQRPQKIEEVDLRDVDDDQGLSRVLEQQRLATIKSQQEQANKPIKMSSLQCIICMETMKDVTATHCGHLFCHSCLMEALIAGENQGSEPGRGTPKCPVCRKKVVRPVQGSNRRGKDDVVPLAMKIKTRKKSGKGKGKSVSQDWV